MVINCYKSKNYQYEQLLVQFKNTEVDLQSLSLANTSFLFLDGCVWHGRYWFLCCYCGWKNDNSFFYMGASRNCRSMQGLWCTEKQQWLQSKLLCKPLYPSSDCALQYSVTMRTFTLLSSTALCMRMCMLYLFLSIQTSRKLTSGGKHTCAGICSAYKWVWYNLLSTHTTFLIANIGYCSWNEKWCPCGWQCPGDWRKSLSPSYSFSIINHNVYIKGFYHTVWIFNFSSLKDW